MYKIEFDYDLMRDRLLNKRIKAKQNLLEAAEEIGLSAATLSRIERSTADIDMNTLIRICEWLKTEPKLFFKVRTK